MLFLIKIIAITLSVAGAAFAGNESGGGGTVIACKSATTNEVTYELLDVYEARQNPKIRIIKSSHNLVKDYIQLLKNKDILEGRDESYIGMEPYFEKRLNDIFSKLVIWHTEGNELPFTNDLGQSFQLPKRCELKQLAVFYDKLPRFLES